MPLDHSVPILVETAEKQIWICEFRFRKFDVIVEVGFQCIAAPGAVSRPGGEKESVRIASGGCAGEAVCVFDFLKKLSCCGVEGHKGTGSGDNQFCL